MLYIFPDNKRELEKACASSENPMLKELEKRILEFHKKDEDSRGILFCKTIETVRAMVDWMKETPSLAELKPVSVTGVHSEEGQRSIFDLIDSCAFNMPHILSLSIDTVRNTF